MGFWMVFTAFGLGFEGFEGVCFRGFWDVVFTRASIQPSDLVCFLGVRKDRI